MTKNFSQTAAFIWSVAEFKQSQYEYILAKSKDKKPLTIAVSSEIIQLLGEVHS